MFKATPAVFHTTWFLESMATQILVIFVIRTNRRPWADLPRPGLVASSIAALLAAMALPFTPVGAWFGFEAPPLVLLATMGAIVVTYLGAVELLKPFATRSPHRRPADSPAVPC